RYTHIRYLHPFPTRRSSDLRARLQQRDVALGTNRAGVDADHANIVGKALSAERAGKGHQRGISGAAADVVGVESFAGGADVVDEDRKSTRLNSSHLGISYAV